MLFHNGMELAMANIKMIHNPVRFAASGGKRERKEEKVDFKRGKTSHPSTKLLHICSSTLLVLYIIGH